MGYIDLIVILILIQCYMIVCPFTKVEESFNMQAIHDLIYRKDIGGLNGFDHLEFPGVVPRTFHGALYISSLASPIVSFLNSRNVPKIWSLYVVRGILGLLFWCGIAKFHNSIKKRDGTTVASWFAWVCASQFHLLFYASRTLPNTFSTCLIMFALAELINGNSDSTIKILVYVSAVIRCDTIVLLGTISLGMLVKRDVTIMKLLFLGVTFGFVSLVLSIPIDSVFWDRPVWPEFEVLFFNTVLNKSKEWGVMPWHWYFTNALPRFNLFTYPMLFIGLLYMLIVRKHSLSFTLILPSVCFVALLSFLPHKELRFIFPVLPVFNYVIAYFIAGITGSRSAVASEQNDKPKHKNGAIENEQTKTVIKGERLTNDTTNKQTTSKTDGKVDEPSKPKIILKKEASLISALLKVGFLVALMLNFALTIGIFLNASITNYPGAIGFIKMRNHANAILSKKNGSNVPLVCKAHISAGAAISGISRFLQDFQEVNGVNWIYSKEENLTMVEYKKFDYLITEHALTDLQELQQDFTQIDVAFGAPKFVKWSLNFQTYPSIYVLENNIKQNDC